jgi:hypothetical protein
VSHAGLQLRGDIRQALENYMGDMVDGPWDDVIDEIAGAIEDGEITAASAARLDLALQRTQGAKYPACPVCTCPCPGMNH